jgi:hypothetical protein
MKRAHDEIEEKAPVAASLAADTPAPATTAADSAPPSSSSAEVSESASKKQKTNPGSNQKKLRGKKKWVHQKKERQKENGADGTQWDGESKSEQGSVKRRAPKRKLAVVFGYNGGGYYGLQVRIGMQVYANE